MKQSIKVQRELDKVAAILAAQGITFNTEEVISDVSEELELEADAVLMYFDFKGKHFVEKTCPICNRIFATNNPRIVGRCSNKCRATALAEIGITWDPYKSTEERWGRHYPLTVPPEALVLLKELV